MFCPNPECSHHLRTGEPAEYRDGVDRCHDCGSLLAETRPEAEEDVGYEEFVPVFEITRAGLVPFIDSLLQSASIRFFIKGEAVQDLFGLGRFGTGFNYVIGPPTVFVEPARAEEARELLEQVSAAGEADLPDEEDE